MECSIHGCIKPIFRKGLCCSHYEVERIAKAPKCSVDGCDTHTHSRGLCDKHYRQELNKEKPECIVEGCGRTQHANGLCHAHDMRKARHGHLEPTRPADWGSKEKHPLHNAYGGMKKKRGIIHIDPRWLEDFWIFVKEVGEKPSPRHTLRLKVESKGYIKDNAYWREPKLDSIKAKTKKETQAKYMREMRKNDPEKFAGYDFKRRYGINLVEYNKMLIEQDNKCLICGQEETAVNRTSGSKIRLAVDHCHDTGNVRGLLCTNCNTLIGRAKDSVDVLKSAILYLENFSE